MAVIGAVLMTWAAAQYARRFSVPPTGGVAAAETGGGERPTLRFFRDRDTSFIKRPDLRWIVLAFAAMVVGWQAVIETINSTVARFNARYFEEAQGPHHEMKVIVAKQAVVAALKELHVSLGNWRDKLAIGGNLSEESIFAYDLRPFPACVDDKRSRTHPSRLK